MNAQNIQAHPGSAPGEPVDAGTRLPRPKFVPALFAVLLALGLVLLDFASRRQLNVAVVYSLPLVFAAASRKPRVLWGLTLCLVAMTFVVYLIQAPLAPPMPPDLAAAVGSASDPYLVDRALAALTVLLTAAILQGWLWSLRTIELRDRAIEENNAELRKANRELRGQRDEITAQNAELERRGHELETLNSRKTQMMASISHDIRTPIQSITLVAELMRRTACAPSGAVQMLALAQRLQSHALSVAELLSEVIDLASFDEGKVVLHVSDFSLNELLQEQCQRLSPQAEAKGLVLRVGDGLLPLNLHSDRAKLGRVLANLANNAIKFTTQGSVTLSFNVDERRCVHIGVADTGCGIRPENLGGIFGDFCQESSPAAPAGNGWGLGLAICRRLTAVLDGKLLVESEAGRGSTFTVLLPPAAIAC